MVCPPPPPQITPLHSQGAGAQPGQLPRGELQGDCRRHWEGGLPRRLLSAHPELTAG